MCIGIRSLSYTITFVNSIQTLLLQLILKSQISYYLLQYFFKTKPLFTCNNTSVSKKVRLSYLFYRTNSRFFYIEAWENLILLFLAFKEKFKKISNTNQERS